MRVTFACQYRDDSWEDGDLLHRGENWNEKQEQVRLHNQQTIAFRVPIRGLWSGLWVPQHEWTASPLCFLPTLIPPHQFSSFSPPPLFRNKIRSNEEAEGNKDSLILLREMSAARLGQVFPGRINTKALGSGGHPSPGLPTPQDHCLWLLTWPLLLLLGHSPPHFSNLSLLFEGLGFINICLYLGHSYTYISHCFCSHIHVTLFLFTWAALFFHVFTQQTHSSLQATVSIFLTFLGCFSKLPFFVGGGGAGDKMWCQQ